MDLGVPLLGCRGEQFGRSGRSWTGGNKKLVVMKGQM